MPNFDGIPKEGGQGLNWAPSTTSEGGGGANLPIPETPNGLVLAAEGGTGVYRKVRIGARGFPSSLSGGPRLSFTVANPATGARIPDLVLLARKALFASGSGAQPGVPGGQAQVAVQNNIIERPAGENIGTRLAVWISGNTALLASGANASGDRAIGLSGAGVQAGETVMIQTSGEIEDAAWTWTSGPVFVGVNGTLTQFPSTARTPVVIGMATSPTKMLIRVQQSVSATTSTDTGESIVSTEALAAGDFINTFLSAGEQRIRRALASDPARGADGFVTAAVASGASGTVKREGTNSLLSGLTIGARYYLSATQAGKATTTVPTTDGHLLQLLGKAVSATQIAFVPDDGDIL